MASNNPLWYLYRETLAQPQSEFVQYSGTVEYQDFSPSFTYIFEKACALKQNDPGRFIGILRVDKPINITRFMQAEDMHITILSSDQPTDTTTIVGLLEFWSK